MKYVVVEVQDYGNFLDPNAYLELLPTFAHDLPIGARAFATDPNHYNFSSRRCVKDLKPATVLHGETAGERWLRLGFRHNCWKHENDLMIHYTGVSKIFPASAFAPPTWEDLNGITLDEILPHEYGCSHEIRFLSGSLTVVSRDLTATWPQAECDEKPNGKRRSPNRN